MHAPRVPLDFGFRYDGYGRFHLASGDTGAFWFGLIPVFGAAWSLRRGLQRGGSFVSAWPCPPADRHHPVMYRTAAAVHVLLLLGGLDFVVSGLIGLEAFSLS